jgi:hypothetical protein
MPLAAIGVIGPFLATAFDQSVSGHISRMLRGLAAESPM